MLFAFSVKNIKPAVVVSRDEPYYARSAVIRQAKGETIIFVDSDVIVFPDFVEDHIKEHKKKKPLSSRGW